MNNNVHVRPAALFKCLAAVFLIAIAFVGQARLAKAGDVLVDTALLVSVDVSNSVDEHRYQLQMEGIAKALEDQGVVDAITGGPNGGILFGMVTWADRPSFVLPWVKISNAAEAKVRKLEARLAIRRRAEPFVRLDLVRCTLPVAPRSAARCLM